MDNTSQRIELLNQWLSKAYAPDARLSLVLQEGGLTNEEIRYIRSEHLAQFLDDICLFLVNLTTGHDGKRANNAMLRYFGLNGDRKETLSEIAADFGVIEAEVAWLIEERLQFCLEYKEQIRHSIVYLAKQILHEAKERALHEAAESGFSTAEQHALHHMAKMAQQLWLELEPEARTRDHLRQELHRLFEYVLSEGKASRNKFAVSFPRPRKEKATKDAKQPSAYAERLARMREKYPNAFKKWRVQDDLRLQELFSAGNSIQQLAEHLQRQPGAVHIRLTKLGLIDE
jgi:AraC-like DNA-binding protein